MLPSISLQGCHANNDAMSSSKDKIQAKRYDAPTEIVVGPESIKLRLVENSKDPILQQSQDVPTYSSSLTSVQEENLAKRCSVYDVQKEVKDALDDKQLASMLRTRLLTWVAEGIPEHVEIFRQSRKRKQDDRVADETEGEEEKSLNLDQNFDRLENATASNLFQRIQNDVPNAFKFMANPSLANAYHQQGGRLDGSVIKKPTPTHLLRISEEETSSEKQSMPSKGSVPFILQISIYSRLPRGMWAKEKFDRVVRSVPLSDQTFEAEAKEVEERSEDEMQWEDGEKYEIPEKTKRGPQPLFGRSGPYESLQLAQKIEIRSDASLEDLRKGFYCRMNGVLEIVKEEEKFKVWNKQVAMGDLHSSAPQIHQYNGQRRQTDSCFMIEERLYSAQSGKETYASLLSSHFARPNEDGAPTRANADERSMSEVRLDSIDLHTGKLYWFLHQGNCEHVWSIESVRLARETECKTSNCQPITTFLGTAFAINPLIRWSRPVKRVDSFSIGDCQLCEKRRCDMIIMGGERFRPLNGRKTCQGLKEDNVGVCERCWYLLNGNQIDYKGAGGQGWTVIPLL